VVDTNCDPSEVDYVIPGNDDALRAIRLFASKISDSVAEGAQLMTDKQAADLAAAVYAEPESVPAADAARSLRRLVLLRPGLRTSAWKTCWARECVSNLRLRRKLWTRTFPRLKPRRTRTVVGHSSLVVGQNLGPP